MKEPSTDKPPFIAISFSFGLASGSCESPILSTYFLFCLFFAFLPFAPV